MRKCNIYIYIYMYMYVCELYVYTDRAGRVGNTHMCLHIIRVYIYMFICIYIYVYVSLYIYMYRRLGGVQRCELMNNTNISCVSRHACERAGMPACMHACMHACTCARVLANDLVAKVV